MVEGKAVQPMPDQVATEEPLEIRLRLAASATGPAEVRPVAVTMRTPAERSESDAELAAGFLYGEGVLRSREEIRGFIHRSSPMPGVSANRGENVVEVELTTDVSPNLDVLDRHFYTSSACGVCGKASLDALLLGNNPALPSGPTIPLELLYALPEKLHAGQGVFHATGGLHAAALFSTTGELVALREDVGRHNALDKLVGWALLSGLLPLHDAIVLVSGRTSYEILQKCLMAEAPIVCGISAPSSLAVSLARGSGITLVGFLREERCNIYAGFDRIRR